MNRPQDGGDSTILEERRGEVGARQAGSQEALAMSGGSWICSHVVEAIGGFDLIYIIDISGWLFQAG